MQVARRSFLRALLAAGVAPHFIPARVLGADAPSKKINVGIVGAGAQGRWDLGNFLVQDDVRVTAICDVNQRNLAAAREQIAKAYGADDVKVYADFRELNADPSIDAVLMALPVHWHSIPSIDAVLRGKHLFHEKPVALSLEEGQRLRAAVQKTGVVFQFGTQQRSDVNFRWACELARNGRLGKLREILVSVPAGATHPAFPEQAVPDYVDWERWVGPAPLTPFHEARLSREHHEHMANFSLGMISCWGIHHLDIAQWGNDADETGPVGVEGAGEFPPAGGGYDAIWKWKVRFEYAQAAPVTFVSDGTPGFEHGVRFVGESGWAHVTRNGLRVHDEALLKDHANKVGAMPVQLAVSKNHTRNFLDAIRGGRRAICDVGPAVRGDTLCQLALIAVQEGRKLTWDPRAERFAGDDAANARLRARPFRGNWKLPAV